MIFPVVFVDFYCCKLVEYFNGERETVMHVNYNCIYFHSYNIYYCNLNKNQMVFDKLCFKRMKYNFLKLIYNSNFLSIKVFIEKNIQSFFLIVETEAK